MAQLGPYPCFSSLPKHRPLLTWSMAVDSGLSLARTFAPGLGLSPSNATAERDRERADTSVSANSVLPGTCELQEALVLQDPEGSQMSP